MNFSKGQILFVVSLIVAWAGCAYLGRSLEHPVPIGNPTPAPAGEDWINLLDEAHVSHWKNVTDDLDIFTIEGGVLHILGKTLHPLRYVGYTGQDFGDFDLHLEFMVRPGANSGVFLRTQEGDALRRGFEVQVLEDFGEPPSKHGSGAIYDVVTPMFNMARPAGEWNSYDITVEGTEVRVSMNGWKVIDTDFSKMTTRLGKFETAYAEMPLEGMLALQDHGGEVWYRNILVRAR